MQFTDFILRDPKQEKTVKLRVVSDEVKGEVILTLPSQSGTLAVGEVDMSKMNMDTSVFAKAKDLEKISKQLFTKEEVKAMIAQAVEQAKEEILSALATPAE